MAKEQRYIEGAQPGLFDSMDRLSQIDRMGDPLANLNAIMVSVQKPTPYYFRTGRLGWPDG